MSGHFENPGDAKVVAITALVAIGLLVAMVWFFGVAR